MIGWVEILEGGLAPNATVMSWRGIEAAKQKHDVVMTPNQYVYFDHYQTSDIDNEPMAIGGYLPIINVYNWEPVPSSLSNDEQKYIIGCSRSFSVELFTDGVNFTRIASEEYPAMKSDSPNTVILTS
jgi:hexosaminidase